MKKKLFLTFYLTGFSAFLAMSQCEILLNKYEQAVTCHGYTDGVLQVTPLTGDSPYTYTTSLTGAYIPPETTRIFKMNMAPGAYPITVTDANGCTASTIVTIAEPLPFTVVPSQTNVSCFDGSNGSMGVVVSGSHTGYQYNWSSGTGNSPTSSGLTAGDYSVTITDNYSCTTIANFRLTQPSQLEASVSKNSSNCYGETSVATVHPTGGTLPYTYLWSNGGTSGSETLAAGSHSVIVSDNKGCTNTVNFSINSYTEIVPHGTHTAVKCYGESNGSATIAPTGGSGDYIYNWSHSATATGTTVSGLGAGNYSVIITDDNDCSVEWPYTIIQPNELIVAVQGTNISCYDFEDGIAITSVTGGNGGQTYHWIPTQETSATITDLSAGLYSVLVIDVKGCVKIGSVTISEPGELIASVSTARTHLFCHGEEATVIVAATGGVLDYTGTGTFSVAAGTHDYTVMDENGCTSATSITITQPDALEIVATATSILCHGEEATVTVTATGGAYDYIGTGTFNVAAGTHDYMVTDDNGCEAETSITITEPAAITSSLNYVLCEGESVVVGDNTYGAAGMYQDVFSAVISGCDSTVTTTITMHAVLDITTTTTANVITSNQENATYQWINCVTNTPVTGATSQTFAPAENGSYAVILSGGSCSDETSECINITTLGLNTMTMIDMKVYPNPSNGKVTIDVPQETRVVIYDLLGNMLYTATVNSGQNTIDLSSLATGIYTIKAVANGNVQTVRWSKQ